MKKTLLVISAFLSFLFIPAQAVSQWQNPVSITTYSSNYNGLTGNTARSIAVSGTNIFVVWRDARWMTIGDIYFRRSTNGGTSWLSEQWLVNNEVKSFNPSVAAYLSTVHVVWEEYKDGNAEIYYKRSNDAGATWGAEVRMTNAADVSEYPAVSVSADGVHVVWREKRDGHTEIYYKRSTNGGSSWSADTKLTNNPSSKGYPSIVTNGMGVHIAWTDYRDGNYEMYYKSSTNNGTNWGSDTRITNNAAATGDPSIATSGLNLYLTFADERTGTKQIFFKKSTNLGLSWSNDQQITSLIANNYVPSIAIGSNGNNIHIAYCNNAISTQYDIYYKRSTNGGVNWGGEDRLTQMSHGFSPHIAVTSTNVHIINKWRSGNLFDIHYWKNATGNPTAVNNTGSEIPSDYSLGQNYPNPFNPNTKISFSLPVNGMVKLAVYDITGKLQEMLADEEMSAGTYVADFNASRLASGVYFYKLIVDGVTYDTKKMMLVK